MTAFCIDKLHRLPAEVHVPTSLLIAAMVAYGVIQQERMEEMEREREWAKSGSER